LTYKNRRRPDRRAPFHFKVHWSGIYYIRSARNLTDEQEKVQTDIRTLMLSKKQPSLLKVVNVTLIAADSIGDLNASKE
jgi:hypothetical protein